MQLTTKNVKLTASSDATHWGGGFCENGLFILLEVEGNVDEPAVNKGKEILDLLLTKITNYKERNLTTITELISWAKGIKSLQTLTLGFLNDNILYLANLGMGEVLLGRKGKVGKILPSGETSSGKIIQGDILLFSSKTFINCIDKEKYQIFFESENLTDIAEEAYTILVSNPNSVGSCALLVLMENSVISQLSSPTTAVSGKVDYKNLIKEKWQNIVSFIRQKQNIFGETEEETKSKKTLLTVAIVLIFLLVASIFLNINHSQSTSKQSKLKQTLELVSHQYDEAVSLMDLNPSRSRLLLSDGKLSLMQIFKEFPKNSNEYKQINDWLSKIAEKEVAAYKIYKYTTVPLFFDINLIKNGGTGSKMALYKETAVILDSKNKAIYTLALDKKQASIVAGSEVVKEAKTIGVHGKSVYLLNADGIEQIDTTTKTVQVVVKPDKEWGDISELVAFAGNFYLLDKKNNTIWKYIVQDTGFSQRSSYLNPDVKVSFAAAGKMIVDGSVWVIVDGGTILKFTSGHGDVFSFQGLADTISDITSFFTNEDTKNLYVLDKRSQRILVFDKNGDYQSQYQWDELKGADDLVVSEEDKKIFVLSAGKIYAIDLK